MVDCLCLPPEQAGRRALKIASEGQLRSWQHAHRQSGIIRTGGVNVSPYEVETVLSKWKRVELAQVVGVVHPTLGEEIVALIVQREGDPVTSEDVLNHLRGSLAAYKVPRRVLFVSAEDFEMTGTEKVRAEGARQLAERILADEGQIDGARVAG